MGCQSAPAVLPHAPEARVYNQLFCMAALLFASCAARKSTWDCFILECPWPSC
ncbi:MAG: hypothetical protein J6Y80_03065 [Victivallales bacterium]|nr:hypothetical protein [Victivallales bacterium]